MARLSIESVHYNFTTTTITAVQHCARTCKKNGRKKVTVKIIEVGGWMDGWVDGWVGGWMSKKVNWRVEFWSFYDCKSAFLNVPIIEVLSPKREQLESNDSNAPPYILLSHLLSPHFIHYDTFLSTTLHHTTFHSSPTHAGGGGECQGGLDLQWLLQEPRSLWLPYTPSQRHHR